MIKIKLQDAEGHGYWLYEDGQFVLALKEKPAVGVQFKTKAWLRKGVLSFHDLLWDKKNKCWYVFRYPLMKTSSFGIQIVFVSAADGDSKQWVGWVHPRILTRREDVVHHTGFEKQVKIFPSDLKKTKELADEVWKNLG